MYSELDSIRTAASNSLSLSTINKKRAQLPQVSWLRGFKGNRRTQDPISTLTFTLSFVNQPLNKLLLFYITNHIMAQLRRTSVGN